MCGCLYIQNAREFFGLPVVLYDGTSSHQKRKMQVEKSIDHSDVAVIHERKDLLAAAVNENTFLYNGKLYPYS
jgi:hypothetical protein